MKVILVHGIHSPEGNNNMSALRPYLKKEMPYADVEVFSYGFMGFWQARWDNDNVAKSLVSFTESCKREGREKVVWVTHSNGGAIAYLATKKYGAKPDMIIQINPALDRRKTPICKWVEVIYSNQDRAVDLSQWLPFHIWGDQGKVGYKGSMKNTISFNASSFGEPMAYEDHCGLFEKKRIRQWASWIAYRIEGMIK
jgi:hypothetical protein